MPDNPHHFNMAAMSDNQHVPCAPHFVLDLPMNFGHKRTGSVEHFQATLSSLRAHLWSDAMRRENDAGALWNFSDLLNEDGAAPLEGFNNNWIVYDWMADKDRWAKKIKRRFQCVNCAIDASAKSPMFGQDDLQLSHRQLPLFAKKSENLSNSSFISEFDTT